MCILCEIKDVGVWVVGIVGEIDIELFDVNFIGLMVVVMGVEGDGMCCFIWEYCDLLVKILMVGMVLSLNVFVVMGICLFEVFC